jgi:hypothetical protein
MTTEFKFKWTEGTSNWDKYYHMYTEYRGVRYSAGYSTGLKRMTIGFLMKDMREFETLKAIRFYGPDQNNKALREKAMHKVEELVLSGKMEELIYNQRFN